VSKRPYDFLVTEKEPLLYLEASILCMDDGFLTVKSGKEGIRTIAPAGILILLLGAGTSITQEAAIFASAHDMQIAFARGRCNVHSVFMSGRYQDPQPICNQVKLVETSKLAVAKELLKLRLLRSNEPAESISAAMEIDSLVNLVAWEGRWAKGVYKEWALKTKTSFRRDFDAADSVNAKLNILNNSLYSVCAAVCLSCGLHPSVGLLHGYTRRGGLAFDLADVFKNQLSLPIAFDPAVSGARDAMYALAKKLRANKSAVVKSMVRICLRIGGQHDDISWESCAK